jgi:hypothetical protein
MNTFHPSRVAFLFSRTATIPEPTLVKVLTLTIGTEPPHHLWRGISQVTKMATKLGNA